MSDDPKPRPAAKSRAPRSQGAKAPNSASKADRAVDPSVENGVSEASAEELIAQLVEAEREAEAEEAAIAAAEEAADSEEPLDDEDEAAETESVVEEPVERERPEPAEDEPVADVVDIVEVEEIVETVDEDGVIEIEEVDVVVVEVEDDQEDEPAAEVPAPSSAARRLAVLGSPIGHSQSPALHRAAYDALGLDWSYEALDVSEAGLSAFIDGLGEEWRGLSLTMPLKKSVIPLLTDADRVAEQTGVANTVLLDGDDIRGFNTDVAGIVRALAAAGLESARYVHILGGGATAASALVAAAELGAERVDVHVRDLEKSVWLEPLAHQLGLMIRIRSFAQADRSLDVPEVVISTLPGGATTAAIYTDSTRRTAVLLDVAYDPWPSALARSWQAVGGHVVSGLAMLAHQALLQVRIFVSGDVLQPLPDEEGVLEAMLAAVGIDAEGAPVGDGSVEGEAE
ncbi:shikimate dehydrogenase [Leifsonia shinshuensis]|uniref:Shikimate dehydrogenase n=1 Tax=Leifsonia shinshuensis TaxID=150026 RepID=A0A853CVD1_9MICO|nr:shikimate dehydrogenase [Leifsonia shinshuensis]NYJ23883.1 shikimate dehydrogenase [Leifsonia shinshuensis]